MLRTLTEKSFDDAPVRPNDGSTEPDGDLSADLSLDFLKKFFLVLLLFFINLLFSADINLCALVLR